MLPKVCCALLGLLASASVASPAWSSSEDARAAAPNKRVAAIGIPPDHRSVRPDIRPSPYQPGKPFPESPSRTKTCYVDSVGGGKDDAANILAAMRECNDGGHVVLREGVTYVVGTALDLTFLKHVDIDIQGTVQFTADTDYWQAHSFKHVYQNASTFFQLGGEDVNVFGGGTIDGNGQAWYDLYARDPLILRPILFGTIGLQGGTISNLKLRYSPQWYNFVANSSGVVFSNIDIAGYSSSANTAKNTDGWDTYRSDNIVIQNSVVNNGDDCVSFKPNSTSIVVQNMHCNGSHGISVGSLGQYKNQVDNVRHVYVYNVTMLNASDMARIKVWPGIDSALSVDLQGGGGLGSVYNVTYKNMVISNVDYAIEITQCYGQSNLDLCNKYPSQLTIANILIEDMKGTTSKKYDPVIGSLICSSPKVCGNITVDRIDVRSPKGFNKFTCKNIDETNLHVNCTS